MGQNTMNFLHQSWQYTYVFLCFAKFIIHTGKQLTYVDKLMLWLWPGHTPFKVKSFICTKILSSQHNTYHDSKNIFNIVIRYCMLMDNINLFLIYWFWSAVNNTLIPWIWWSKSSLLLKLFWLVRKFGSQCNLWEGHWYLYIHVIRKMQNIHLSWNNYWSLVMDVYYRLN